MVNKLFSLALNDACRDFSQEMTGEQSLDFAISVVETRLVRAAWTLRRMPDRETGWLANKTQWPDTAKSPEEAYGYEDISAFEVRLKARLSSREVDDMQPALDMLDVLPDIRDKQLLFWVAWHQEGELLERIPWTAIKRSLAEWAPSNSYAGLSRWTLKNYYSSGIEFLAKNMINKTLRGQGGKKKV